MSVQVESPLYPSWPGLIRPSTRGVNGAQGLDLRLITHRVRRAGQARVGMGPILDQRSVSDMDSNHLVKEILDFLFRSPDSAELGLGIAGKKCEPVRKSRRTIPSAGPLPSGSDCPVWSCPGQE